MIIVVDNKQEYSMHKIWFVDVPDDLSDKFCNAIEDYAKNANTREPSARVVARGNLEWWNGEPASIDSFLKDIIDNSHEHGCDYWQYDDQTPPCVCWIGKIKELSKGDPE